MLPAAVLGVNRIKTGMLFHQFAHLFLRILEGLLEKVLQNENELKTLSGQLGIEPKEG